MNGYGCSTEACRQADGLLFRAGNAAAVNEACWQSPIGKLLPNALYVHRSALDSPDPLLRVYEGCARSYLGEIEGANVIKLHRRSGKVSYLVYPYFEIDPHSALLLSVKLSLRTREIECREYAARPAAAAKREVSNSKSENTDDRIPARVVSSASADGTRSQNPPILHRKERS